MHPVTTRCCHVCRAAGFGYSSAPGTSSWKGCLRTPQACPIGQWAPKDAVSQEQCACYPGFGGAQVLMFNTATLGRTQHRCLRFVNQLLLNHNVWGANLAPTPSPPEIRYQTNASSAGCCIFFDTQVVTKTQHLVTSARPAAFLQALGLNAASRVVSARRCCAS